MTNVIGDDKRYEGKTSLTGRLGRIGGGLFEFLIETLVQAFTKPNRQLKHPVVRGEDQNVPRGIQNGRADFAMLQMTLDQRPRLLRE
jgi:hypothetical protein